jgi:ATP-dependent Clp protease adaptor protein ClpS
MIISNFGLEYDVEILIEEETEIDENEAVSKRIIIYNDDINSFDHVIRCLVVYCGHSYEQAEQCAFLIHTKGKYSVKEGNMTTLKPINEALCENGLDSRIE